MKDNNKILFLYAEVVGYVQTLLNTLVENYPVEVHVVYWDKKHLSQYKIQSTNGKIFFYPKSETNLKDLIVSLDPNLIVVSGWMDKDYVKICKQQKGKTKIVCASDTKWLGTIKQRLVSIVPAKFALKRFYDYFWVAGARQYAFARNMGFADNDIIQNLYSADVKKFNQAYQNNLSFKENTFPHCFFYVGRISPEKGCDLLIEAFENISKKLNHDWKLVLIGNGQPIYKPTNPNVYIKGFMTADELALEVKNAGVFCMPSHREQWGVANHEFCVSGLAMLSADICGSNAMFVIDGYNGYTFKHSNLADLEQKMTQFIQIDNRKLFEMGKKSNLLGQRITPEISVASLMSVL